MGTPPSTLVVATIGSGSGVSRQAGRGRPVGSLTTTRLGEFKSVIVVVVGATSDEIEPPSMTWVGGAAWPLTGIGAAGTTGTHAGAP